MAAIIGKCQSGSNCGEWRNSTNAYLLNLVFGILTTESLTKLALISAEAGLRRDGIRTFPPLIKSYRASQRSSYCNLRRHSVRWEFRKLVTSSRTIAFRTHKLAFAVSGCEGLGSSSFSGLLKTVGLDLLTDILKLIPWRSSVRLILFISSNSYLLKYTKLPRRLHLIWFPSRPTEIMFHLASNGRDCGNGVIISGASECRVSDKLDLPIKVGAR